MKRFMIVLVVLTLLSGCSSSSEQKERPTIAVLQFGDFASLNDTYQGIEEIFEEQGINVVYKNANADTSVLMMNAQSIQQEEVDAVIGITTQSAQTAINVFEHDNIPIIFSAVSNPEAIGITDAMDFVTGVTDTAPYLQQLQLIEKLTPDVKKVGIVNRIGDVNGIYQVEQIKAAAASTQLEIVNKGVNDVQELGVALPMLTQEVDAMFVITDDLNVSGTSLIVDHANKKSIPVYASEDGQLEEGILASVSINYVEIGRQTAKLALRALNEKNLKIETPEHKVTKINQKVATELGIKIPEEFSEFTF
ncbi:ABC transporter substrate-binding protein [Erysipelothrix anatis]|uniref:ABC transporter substrate-binding protein n=1 Tax=Erysipelothrix anatis TaxID=2683713 RepID=UPI0013584459|nr:ABC transporter substrate-binding protein [Erysipelothrix anatis]